MTGSVLGLDIGGANLKAAHTDGVARVLPFALWKAPGQLAAALARLVASMPAASVLAVTMTGELCDCWESKRQGVAAILDAVAGVAGTAPVRVWTNQGDLVDLVAARSHPLKVASANWLALATFAGRFAPSGPTLLIDCGTTTTDIIPLVEGQPRPKGRTDPERLASGELVYRGWKRTPACALVTADRAAEFFATTHDAYLVLKGVPEDPADHDTADGRPATRVCAIRRLARMLCGDLETIPMKECWDLAREINLCLVEQVALGVEAVSRTLPGAVQAVLAAGSGEFLIPSICHSLLVPGGSGWPIVSLSNQLGEEVSAAACAYALAVLCQEREG